MTTINIEKTNLGRNISVSGHASTVNDETSSADGRIICTAVSTITQTLAQYLLDAEDLGTADIIDITLKSGNARISYITDDDSVNIGADAICRGFWLLGDSFPDRVCVQ